jgi:predicted outer membrane repeat protein
MWLSILRKRLTNLHALGSPSRQGGFGRGACRRYRPLLEALEDRLAPATLTVLDNSDSASDAQSLRYALANANSGDVIDFAPSVRSIALTAGLTIGTNVTITNDLGSGPVTVDGGGHFTVFTVNSGVTATLSGLTIAHGNGSKNGGGIENAGTLTVSNCTFSSNTSVGQYSYDGASGGIGNRGTLTVSNCTFSNNSSVGQYSYYGAGGGIGNTGTLTVSNSTFSNNFAGGSGGGIYNAGTLTVSNSTFSANSTSDFGSGGGIASDDATATFDGTTATLLVSNCTFSANTAGGQGGIEGLGGQVTVTDSTFANNSCYADGGGIGVTNATLLTVSNCTFSNNSAGDEGGGISCSGATTVSNCTFYGNTTGGNGGGLWSQGGRGVTVTDSTFANNSAASAGGGIEIDYGNGALVLKGDIVVGNFAASAADDVHIFSFDPTAPALDPSSSDNLVGVDAAQSFQIGHNGNQVGVSLADAGLAPLGDYGGPTQTMALLPGSFALRRGITATTATTDQRGVARPVGSPGDVGAYESGGFTVTISGDKQSTQVNTPFSKLLQVTVSPVVPGDPVAGGIITFTANPGVNGASAVLSTPTITLTANGIASTLATANGAAGAYTITALACGTTMATFHLTNLGAGPAITSADHVIFHWHQPASFTVTTTGFPTTPTLTDTGALPGGVTFTDRHNGTALITGTPSSVGNFPLTIKAHNNAGGDATQQFTLMVYQAPGFVSDDHVTVKIDKSFDPLMFQVKTVGFPIPTLTETGALPSGVTFKDGGYGVATLKGYPNRGTGGSYTITIRAHNDAGDVSQLFHLNVDEAPAIVSPDHATFVAGAASFTVQTTGLPLPTLTLDTVDSRLPVKLTDNHDGTATLAGFPGPGGYRFVIKARNSLGIAQQDFHLTVSPWTRIRTSTTLTSPSNVYVLNQPITLTATVTARDPAPAPPTGTITFFYGKNTKLGTAVLNGGTASYTFLAPDKRTSFPGVWAVYNNDPFTGFEGSSSVTSTLQVKNVALEPDPLTPGRNDLFVGANDVHIRQTDASHLTADWQNGSFTVNPASIAGIVVYGGANSSIRIDNSVTLPALLFGGTGVNSIVAGGGPSVLVGGARLDILQGGAGRSILIGGGGGDTLRAGPGGSILIGGTVSFSRNLAALDNLLAEWALNTDYATRVNHLLGNASGGINGSTLLNGFTIRADPLVDILDGSLGLDLFFASVRGNDLLLGRTSTELVAAVW